MKPEHTYKKIKDMEENENEKEIENLKEKAKFKEYEDQDEKPEVKWTSRMKIMAVITFTIHFIVFGAIALIMPYFPTVVSIVAILSLNKGIKIFSLYICERVFKEIQFGRGHLSCLICQWRKPHFSSEELSGFYYMAQEAAKRLRLSLMPAAVRIPLVVAVTLRISEYLDERLRYVVFPPEFKRMVVGDIRL